MTERPQALRALRVLELGDYVSAAYCGRLLADFGAEVIKVERPQEGDLARRHGPFPSNEPDPECSGLFIALNTNKLGITLDFTTPPGRDLLLELAAHVDVVVENHHPDDLERWSITYADLRTANPSIVMTSITPYGHDGPYSRHKAYAINTSAMAGAAHRIGKADRYPLAMPYERADLWGGMNGAPATMLALAARRRTGRGQHVDVSSAECINAFGNGGDIIHFADSGTTTHRHGIRAPLPYPYTVLPCKDGHFGLILGYQRHWERFGRVMGDPPWAKEPRYLDRAQMGFAYPEEVDELVRPWLAQHTKQEIWGMCRENGIPYHPVQTVDEVLDWEQLRARDYWDRVPDARGREWTLAGAPFKMGRTPARRQGPAPRLGQHNAHIYEDLLGRSAKELADLGRTGIV